MQKATHANLADAILDLLVAANGSEAPSYLVTRLRDLGWTGLGCLTDFEDELRRMGFALSRRLKKDGTPAKSGLVVSL